MVVSSREGEGVIIRLRVEGLGYPCWEEALVVELNILMVGRSTTMGTVLQR